MKNNVKEEVEISIIKSLFGPLPVVGPLLDEVLFEFRGRIKQERLNRFIIMLADYFKDNQNIDIDNLKTEDFSDLFESVLKRVVQTKSEEKHERFRNILVNHIKNSNLNIDDTEIYLDLISTLSDFEINILKHHMVFDTAFIDSLNKLNEMKRIIESNENYLKHPDRENPEKHEKVLQDTYKLMHKVSGIQKIVDDKQKARNSEFYEISEERFMYYKQVLISKGLMFDNGVGAMDYKRYEYMFVTEFGIRFLEFIIEEK